LLDRGQHPDPSLDDEMLFIDSFTRPRELLASSRIIRADALCQAADAADALYPAIKRWRGSAVSQA